MLLFKADHASMYRIELYSNPFFLRRNCDDDEFASARLCSRVDRKQAKQRRREERSSSGWKTATQFSVSEPEHVEGIDNAHKSDRNLNLILQNSNTCCRMHNRKGGLFCKVAEMDSDVIEETPRRKAHSLGAMSSLCCIDAAKEKTARRHVRQQECELHIEGRPRTRRKRKRRRDLESTIGTHFAACSSTTVVVVFRSNNSTCEGRQL